MEQQAKERLTGGVILVIVLVLLVPELLTGPRRAPPPPPALPDQAPMRSYTMDLGESPHASSAPVAASTAIPATREPAVTTGSAAAPAPRVPVAAPPASVAPQESAAPLAEPPADVTPAPTAAPAARPLSPSPPPRVAAEHTAAAWTVQLATFSSRDNALHLIAQLKSHGFTGSLTEATRSGHKLFRVRVGSERDRAAAQKLLARLKAAGQKGGEVVQR